MASRQNTIRDISPIASLGPAARTATVNGTGVDLATFEGAGVLIVSGTVTDGVHTPSLQESTDNTTFTNVAAGDMDGTFAVLASGVNQKVGYVGAKRYLRVVMTITGATTGAVSTALIVRGGSHVTPAP